MVTDNLRFALRSLAKYRMYTLVNLFGLTLGLTAFLVIALYIVDELSYDRYHPNADRSYQLIADMQIPGQTQRRFAILPAPLAATLQERFPEVEATTRYILLGRADLSYENNAYYEPILAVEPGFFDFFALTFLQGSPATALLDPNSVVVTQSTAIKYFGNENPIGKVLSGSRGEMVVSAVVADPPGNTHMRFSILTPFPPYLNGFIPNWETSWLGNAFSILVRVAEGADMDELQRRIATFINTESPIPNREAFSPSFLAMPDIHFYSQGIENQYNVAPGNINAVYTLQAVALFLILIACINYTNLATARSINRAHEISLRKVLGAQRSQLIVQLLAEALVLTVLAMVLAISITQMLLPVVNGQTGKALQLAILLQPGFLLGIAGIAVGVGLAAGVYPAIYLSNMAVINGLRDQKSASARAGILRKLLVVTQFTLSVVLVFCTLVVVKQMGFIQSTPLGFDKTNVIAVDINSQPVRNNFETIKSEFRRHPQVLDVSVSTRLPGDWKDIGTAFGLLPGQDEENTQRLSFIGIDQDFLTTYSITQLEGRNFDNSTSPNDVIVNQRFVDLMGWESGVGQQFRLSGEQQATDNSMQANIIGVVEDFHYLSLHNEIGPLVLGRHNNPLGAIDYYSVKMSGIDNAGVIAHLQSVMQQHDPVTPFEYNILESQIETLYSSDEVTMALFTAAASLAVLIACMGLFGLSSFTTQQRSKEIGIRKVLGATIINIVELLSADFMKLVFLAIVIALPLGYYLMSLWLQNFAYSGGIPPDVFILSALLAVLVSMATVSIQSVRTAMRNPVDSISYE